MKEYIWKKRPGRTLSDMPAVNQENDVLKIRYLKCGSTAIPRNSGLLVKGCRKDYNKSYHNL